MKLLILALIIEVAGIGCLVTALIEGMDKNPAIYLAPMGACLLAVGGLLWVKVYQNHRPPK